MKKGKQQIDYINASLKERKWVLETNIGSHEKIEYFAANFGTLQNQYGQKLYHVHPNTDIYSANSSKGLYPHTDRNEHSDPEITIGLYCESADRFDQGGYTGICNMEPFINSLSSQTLNYLLNTSVTIVANGNLQKMGVEHYFGPMLKIKDDGSYTFRFSFNFTQVLQDDSRFLLFREKVVNYYNLNKIMVKIPNHGILLFDNSICLHSRTDITDLNRSLYRLYIKR